MTTEATLEPHRTWLTPLRCRLILAIVLAFGFLSHVRYLTNNCPIDLSGDEAHYWDWSRQLDICYYSKGPMVAWIMRGSCALFGDNMPAVRLPALVLAVGTSLLTYALTRRLFGSERLALGAVLMSHLVPMFIAGSVIMTIDPPFYFFWAAATACAWLALEGRNWAWPLVGLAAGLGFLSKFSMPIWLIGIGGFMVAYGQLGRQLRNGWFWLGAGLMVLLMLPPVVWNAQHGWVSFLHVRSSTGDDGKAGFNLLTPLGFIGGQVGALGPPVAVILVAAVMHALRAPADDPARRPMRFLLWIAAPFFLSVAMVSLWKEPQVNWPAPAYFTLLILSAHFLGTRMAAPALWRRWRGWLIAAIALGLIAMPLLHNTELLYRPVQAALGRFSHKPPTPRKWDPTARLRGWKELGEQVSAQLPALDRPFILAPRYDETALLAFYVTGQPRTYYAGSWFSDPKQRGRAAQYDLWPDRRLDRPELLGRDAVYVGGTLPADLAAAFERVEQAPPLEITRKSVNVRHFVIWRCYDYRGLHWPGPHRSY